MPFHIHVHHHPDQETAERLTKIERMLGQLLNNSEIAMSAYDDIKAKMQTALETIQKNTDLDTSILQTMNAQTDTIKQLKVQLDNAGTDQSKLLDLSSTMDQIIQQSQNEAAVKPAAITANTPVDPAAANTQNPAPSAPAPSTDPAPQPDPGPARSTSSSGDQYRQAVAGRTAGRGLTTSQVHQHHQPLRATRGGFSFWEDPMTEPASIRYKNPGAMWGSALAGLDQIAACSSRVSVACALAMSAMTRE
jgi:hypothetical protein